MSFLNQTKPFFIKILKKILVFNSNSFSQKPRIITLVVFFHFILILFVMVQDLFSTPIKKKSLIVKTVSFNQKTQIPKPIVSSAIKEIPAPAKKEPIKKTTPKKPTLPKTKPVAKKIEKKSLPKVNTPPKKQIPPRDLSDELQESISKIAKLDNPFEEEVVSKDLYVPASLRNLNLNITLSDSDNSASDSTASYQERLISELQDALEFPEYGEVKVAFTLNLDGKISDLRILTGKSKKNQDYLKNSLPNLTFTWFNQFSRKAESFTIVFKNENKL
ncbi:MAG: hypothetical protein HZB76_04040 [Chlamydiae bacterium]|nr:hypothetical protein [Chlamydiota bacterium]